MLIRVPEALKRQRMAICFRLAHGGYETLLVQPLHLRVIGIILTQCETHWNTQV